MGRPCTLRPLPGLTETPCGAGGELTPSHVRGRGRVYKPRRGARAAGRAALGDVPSHCACLAVSVTPSVGVTGAGRAAALGAIDPSFPRGLCCLICCHGHGDTCLADLTVPSRKTATNRKAHHPLRVMPGVSVLMFPRRKRRSPCPRRGAPASSKERTREGHAPWGCPRLACRALCYP